MAIPLQQFAACRSRRKPSARAVKIHRSYTIEGTARVTGCAKGTIRRWVASGELPAITTERPYLILGADLVDFIKARRAAGKRCATWLPICLAAPSSHKI